MEKTFKDVQLSNEPLIPEQVRNFISHPENGGQCVFIGTVRNDTKGRRVSHIDFESYAPMAIKEMDKIAANSLDKFDINHIAIHHRLGRLTIGEIPVIIAVGSAHRKAAFEACSYAIDSLKESVPIWKKEFLEDGEVWVSAFP